MVNDGKRCLLHHRHSISERWSVHFCGIFGVFSRRSASASEFIAVVIVVVIVIHPAASWHTITEITVFAILGRAL